MCNVYFLNCHVFVVTKLLNAVDVAQREEQPRFFPTQPNKKLILYRFFNVYQK